MAGDAVIATVGLTKRYGAIQAVDDIALQVRRGEIYGFLGRNGAGKTTTIRMLLGLIRPTAGTVRIFGHPIGGDQRWLRRVGFLVETATAYPNLTVAENLDLQRRLTGATRASLTDAIERLGLAPYADRRAGRLSLGNQQRLSLARALLHSPELLILDEPANGLDPAGIVEVRELLRTLAGDRGVTVLMSSHILAEVAHLADRIGIIDAGRLVEEAPRDVLAARARDYVRDTFTDAERQEALLTADLERYFLAQTGPERTRTTP
ncbi:MAG: ABC transporter ATP-binding protein [Micropruina sp.]|nr:ABC transporter ATP-binding protein [Micropruina sp.]